MVVFVFLVLVVGYAVSYYYGSPIILFGAFVFAIIMNFVAYWKSDSVALALSGAKKAKEQEYAELHRVVENLAITAGLPKPKVYIINDPSPNAFATGRDPKHSAIAVTTGLLNILDRSELEGVLAHELSHIGNRDTLVMTVVVVLVGFLAIISDMFWRMGLFSSRDRKGNPILFFIAIFAIIIAPFIAKLIQLAISRKREYLADASGALLTRYPEGLASALEKIKKASIPMQRQSTAIAHLYISEPTQGNQKKGFLQKLALLFDTHPPIDKRIQILREMN